MVITLATEEDLPLVWGLLDDAARWIAARGINQWPVPFPHEIVETSLGRRDTCLARDSTEVVGTLAVYWDDPLFWGEQPADAGYVHRLAVARHRTGEGLGELLLDWAAQHVREAGRSWLRLDTGADNAKLRRFYEGRGFVHRGDRQVHVRGAGGDGQAWHASLYERSILSDERL